MARVILVLLVFAAVYIDSLAALKCYSRSGEPTSGNGTSVTCNSMETSCYNHYLAETNQAGCGDCSFSTSHLCTTCTTDHCNNQTLGKCYSVTLPVNKEYKYNQNQKDCYGTNQCHTHTFLIVNSERTSLLFFAKRGCGNCHSINTHQNCAACNGHNCNSASLLVAGARMRMIAAGGVLLFALIKMY